MDGPIGYQGDSFAATVIARAIKVPGKASLTRIDNNAVGQTRSVIDIGHAPTFKGMQSAGQIERTTRDRYAKTNGWSLLSKNWQEKSNRIAIRIESKRIYRNDYPQKQSKFTPPPKTIKRHFSN